MLLRPKLNKAEELYKRVLYLQNRPQEIHIISTEDLKGLKQDITLNIRRKKGLVFNR
jgi:hypothetical protein